MVGRASSVPVAAVFLPRTCPRHVGDHHNAKIIGVLIERDGKDPYDRTKNDRADISGIGRPRGVIDRFEARRVPLTIQRGATVGDVPKAYESNQSHPPAEVHPEHSVRDLRHLSHNPPEIVQPGLIRVGVSR